MIDALIAGKLQGQPTEKTGKSGKPFVIAKVRAAGGDGESLFVNVITFSHSTGAALLALGDGDSVALCGVLTPKAWTDREGCPRPALDLIAHQVLTAYHVTRKRKSMEGEQRQPEQQQAQQLSDDFGAAGEM
jgi:single-stranded DNA-binding protein